MRHISGTILHRLDEELASIRARSLDRTLEVLEGAHFCSNDYLGFRNHPDLIAAAGAAIDATGVAATGSRLLSGNTREWEALESAFAAFVGAEAALFFNSGYAANVGLLSAVLRDEDIVYSDAANHASLIDGIRLARCRKVVFPHLDLDFLEGALGRDSRTTGERFIAVESLFSMDGDRAPVEALVELAERHGANLIVDEAHAVGVLGPTGRGLVPMSRRPDALFAAIYTCGKALASAGAFVAGSATLKDFLINRARTFIYSTALPPYMAAQIGAALRLAATADDLRRRLEEAAARLRGRLEERGFNTGASDSQIVPVILGRSEDALAAAEALRHAGYPVRAIRPPTVPEGSARLRLSVTADTPDETIDGLVEALARHRDGARTAQAPLKGR